MNSGPRICDRTPRALLKSAAQALARGEHTLARSLYDDVLKLAPDSADANAGAAASAMAQGREGEAQRLALRALSEIPTHPVALKTLARTQLAAGAAEKARKLCQCLLTVNPRDVEAQALLAQCTGVETATVRHGNFDSYVSLGSNCEPGLQMMRIGYTESSFFRYTLADYDVVCRLIVSDFAGVYQRENLIPHSDGMIRDTGSGVGFHSDLCSRLDPATGRRTFTGEYDFAAIHRDEASKAEYLAEKWRKLAASSARVLYVMKFEDVDARAKAEALRDLIHAKYPRHDFQLLFLQTMDRHEAPWATDRVVNRYLSRFAPIADAHDADRAAWNRLFADFPLRQPDPVVRPFPVFAAQ